MDETGRNTKFESVLEELLSLDANKNHGVNRVLKELVVERLQQQNETSLLLRRQQEEFQKCQERERRQNQERQDELLARQDELLARQDELSARQDKERQEAQKRQDMFVSKMFEVVNKQSEEISFLRTISLSDSGGVGVSNFAPSPISKSTKNNLSQELMSPYSGEERNDAVSKLVEQQEAMVLLLKRKEEEISELMAGGGGRGRGVGIDDGGGGVGVDDGEGGYGDDYGEGARSDKKRRRVSDSQRKEEPKSETTKSKADIPEFDSLHEIEAGHNEFSDLEVSSKLEFAVNEYEVSNRPSVMTGPPLINVSKGEKKNDRRPRSGRTCSSQRCLKL